MKYIALIDNNVLANFFDIEQVDLLLLCRNLFEYILIPESVKNEILNYKSNNKTPIIRERFVSKLNTERGFFRLCTTIDLIQFAFLQTIKNIHKGEAEIISQAEKRNIKIFFTEDKECIKYIEEKHNTIRYFDTLFLIALLDINKLIDDQQYKFLLHQLKNKHGFNTQMLRSSYIKALKFLDLQINKKIISKKTGFKALGL